jgi:hypothetical protein
MSRSLVLVLLLIGGVHPNPGPTSVKQIFNQASPSQHNYTLPFTDSAPDFSRPASIPHLMSLVLPPSLSGRPSVQPAPIPSLLSLDLNTSQRNQTVSQGQSNAPASQASNGNSIPCQASNSNSIPSQASNSNSIPSQASNNNSITSQASASNSIPSQPPASNSIPSQPNICPSLPVLPPQCRPGHTFLQFNVNGIKNSLTELNNFLHENQIKVACLQETRLSAKVKTPAFPGYAVLRKDRQVGNGGGIAILVHHSISYSPLDTSDISRGDGVMELQGITATINGIPLNIFNVYLPPSSSCPPLYKPSLNPLLNFSDADSIIMGDMNAHHEDWYASSTCARGEAFSEDIDSSLFCVLNLDMPTRLANHGTPNSPDLSLISAHLALSAVWNTNINLNSDHLPITIDVGNETPPVRQTRTYTNFRLADWAKYLMETEASFAGLPDPVTCDAGERVFWDVLLTASGHCIPSGHRKEYTPGLPHVAVPLVNRRDELCRADSQDAEIPHLNEEISDVICEASRMMWINKVESCGLHANPSKFRGLLRNLSGKRARQPPNQPITFGRKTLSKPQSIAKSFNRQYTSVGTHKQRPKTRRVIRNIGHKHKLDPDFNRFTKKATSDAISLASNSTATGPDGLTKLQLKHLGPRGISFLTKLFKLSLKSANLPTIWKAAHIIPIPKPGKPLNVSTSYHPISLLSPVVKILERLLLPFINPPSLPLSSTQHSFWPFCSTTSCLFPLVNAAVNGFNERKPPTRTAVVALDISKASLS